MEITQILSLLCGIALFLFGMTQMGDGLKKASGSKLEPILFRLSGTPLRGLLLGTGVTAVLQSSSATSVMAVGFVNSGMMKVRQSIGVILGSMLGTSVTGWIICLSYTGGGSGLGSILSSATITAVSAVLGILLRSYSRNTARQHVGDVFLGFAVLMLGMSTMSGAMEGLREDPRFIALLTSMSNPVAAILVGAVFTAVLQSCSAAVGILQALSVTGAITFAGAFPLLLGIAVGAAAPVLFSAIGASTEGKRAALIYPVAAVIGSAACAALYFLAKAVFQFSLDDMVMDPFSLAAANSILRFVLVVLLIPFTGPLDRLMTVLVPDRGGEQDEGPHLEERFLAYPELAVRQSEIAIRAMAGEALHAVEAAVGLLREYTPDGMAQVQALELAGDRYEDALGSYLLQITERELTEEQNGTVSAFLHVLTDLERLTDQALNIAESARELQEKQLFFSPEAQRELNVVTDAVTEAVRLAVGAFRTGDTDTARKVDPLEELIDELCDRLQRHHVERLQQGKCSLLNGFILNDLATALERIADHCDNIAAAILELTDPTRPRHSDAAAHDPAFLDLYQSYAARYTM